MSQSSDEESVEEFDYDDVSEPEDEEPELSQARSTYRVNPKKFTILQCAEFVPAERVSSEVDIGDIIHIIHRKHGYTYVQCIVDYLDAEYAVIHRIDTTGYAERTYKFKHGHFLVFKMPAEYWKAVLSHPWKPAISKTSIDTKESQNELADNE